MRLNLILFFFYVLFFDRLNAQEVDDKHLKAECVYRFLNYVEWPKERKFSVLNDTIFIAVYGNSNFDEYLTAYTKSKANKNKTIIIHKIHSIESIKNYHLLYIARSQSNELAKVIHLSNEAQVLTISDTPGFGEDGVLINFFQQGEYLRFEINYRMASAVGFQINSKLLRIAKVFK